MHARSAVFNVYGDLLADRGHRSTVAGLVRLLAPVGITAPAVRTAVSRMVSQGWLTPVRLPSGRGYCATERAVQRFQSVTARALRTGAEDWDGQWHIALLSPPTGRTERARLTRELSFLGLAPMQDTAWVSPYPCTELPDVLARNQASAVMVTTADVHPSQAPLQAWDLDALARSYQVWHAAAADRVAHFLCAHTDPDEAAFAARFHLVDDWRQFVYTDPGLPLQLLPKDWPGIAAAQYFEQALSDLDAGANRFVARVLADS